MVEERPESCPRCCGELVRNHHELVCLVHGQVWEEPRRVLDGTGWCDADRVEARQRAGQSTEQAFCYRALPLATDAPTAAERKRWIENLRALGRTDEQIARIVGAPLRSVTQPAPAPAPAKERPAVLMPGVRMGPRVNRLPELREAVVTMATMELRRALSDTKTYLATWNEWAKTLSREEMEIAAGRARERVGRAS